jgi:hypothetical protein
MKKAVIDEANSSAFTHIVLVVMGWNNDQQKALVSINSMIGQMTAEAAESDRPFHPLIIGVTWPSMWLTGEWLPVPSQAVVLASLLNKANDADMIGRDLVRPMICKSLIARAKANKLIPLVMIGHSFGARILVEALRQTDEGPCLDSEQKVFAFKPDDRLILLEGAFDISRLYGPHGWALDVQKLRVTLTASEHDQATSSAFWGSYAGNILTFERVCRQQPSMCGQAQVEGRYGFDICKQSRDNHTTQSAPDVRSPVRYFDASSLINCRAPLHHGGAHDDIFRRETARFLLDEIG